METAGGTQNSVRCPAVHPCNREAARVRPPQQEGSKATQVPWGCISV